MDMDKGTQECTPLYSTGEEIANSVLHGIATLLSVAGLIGLVILAVRRIPYNHAIWHGFVLAASICHFLAVYNLLPYT